MRRPLKALQWTGELNWTVYDFFEDHANEKEGAMQNHGKHFYIAHKTAGGGLIVRTPEGDKLAQIGDYIIKEGQGVFYLYRPDVFEELYREVPAGQPPCADREAWTMNFGEALEAVKAGKKITRKGWNGRGMFVVYQKAYPKGIPSNKQMAEAWGLDEGELFRCEPYLQIKMTNGSHSMWVPSINDVLAEDWGIV